MVKLYRYNSHLHKWVFVDLGLKSNAEKYADMGFIVVFI